MFIGIDVGGTNLKAGLVDEAGRILAVERAPLDFQGPELFAEATARLAQEAARRGGASLTFLLICLQNPACGGENM